MGSAGQAASGFSIASLGLQAGGDVLAGYGKQAEYQVKATNYLYEGETRAANYRMQSRTQAENDLYEGAAKKAEYGLQASKDEMLADQASRAADFGRLQAGLTDVTMREDLNRTLGNISVIRAAGRADPTSPTTAAIEGQQEMVGERQRSAALLTINSQVAEDEASANYLRSAASFALGQGDSAAAMAGFNAKTALAFGDYNASVAQIMGGFSATAAGKAGNLAEEMGWVKGTADILAGIGKAVAA